MRITRVLLILMLLFSVSAFADIIDPNVGFCPSSSADKSACFTGTGLGGETIQVASTGFDMASNGSQDSNSPWYLLLAIPEISLGDASAPTITSGSFSQQGTTQNRDGFSWTTSGDIYNYVSTLTGGLTGDNSMNAANMFCDGATIPCISSNEINAFGSLPNYFNIFVYEFSPGFNGNTLYSFTSSTLPSGTYLAAVGIGGTNNNIQFSTPFTTTGLVYGGEQPPPIPEPASLMLLGSGLSFVAYKLRNRK